MPPDIHPHEALAAGGSWWTSVDEIRPYRYEAASWALDVYERLWLAPRAGFEITRR